MLRFLFALPFVFLLNPPVHAADEKPLGMVTGPKTGTYIAIGRDIAKAAKAEGIEIEVKDSGGSIDNIKRITSGENAALGIVQSDVLTFLKRSHSPDTQRAAEAIRLVFPLYPEEIHILAHKDIKSISDLMGKNVVIGEESSGSMLTSVNLFSILGVMPGAMMKISPPEGVVAVLRKEADAMIFVGGKPVRVFKNLEDLNAPENKQFVELLKDVHFVPLKESVLLRNYGKAEITHEDYNFVTDPVPTLSVHAALVAYDFSASGRSYSQDRCEQVRKVAKAIGDNILKLKKDGHSKWKQVDLNAQLGIWQKDVCTWPDQKPEAADQRSIDHDLLNIVGQGRDDEKK